MRCKTYVVVFVHKCILTTCQAMFNVNTKPNLPVLTITTPNGFRIGPSATKIMGVSKQPLAVNNPVGQAKVYHIDYVY